MGRPPIFRKAMTKTQIQRRWRAKVKRAKRDLRRQDAEQRRAREGAGAGSSKT
jgi:hypothetical protein